MTTFELDEAVAVLSRTPGVLRAMLAGLPEPWARCDEGPDTFSPHEVLGHLIHGEQTDWIPRARLIFQHGAERPFEPFDRFAQRRLHAGQTTAELLDLFASLRAASLTTLAELRVSPEDLRRSGTHPELGPVTLEQLLATWVVHDLTHIVQVSRVMARRYADAVGPWRAYLSVLNR